VIRTSKPTRFIGKISNTQIREGFITKNNVNVDENSGTMFWSVNRENQAAQKLAGKLD